ncbi:helix-turn-helix transcriptional regulator [Siccibacter turicensis]|uniref:helix-turn-helix transcriptional regulator n=1 Tax=Siccibacter turicensis TaxID=357233 RepID=UPI001F0FEAAF|nr:helix-turn-helix domain-containing protein [Siccibacter turicensis]MDY0970690.1 helix-turn-helix domain-containing protein [Siccibacter turicensis]
MLLSKSAYARRLGVSRQTVYGWIARGEIVISSDQVDVEASHAKQHSGGAGDHQNEMTWAQAAAWVWEHDGGKALPADMDDGQRIEGAAAELGFDVRHEPDKQLLIVLRLDEETHSFYGKDRAADALRFLRSELAYVATMHPDTLGDWNKTGLMSLCLLDGEKL